MKVRVSFINQFQQDQRSQDNLLQHSRHDTKTQTKPTQATLVSDLVLLVLQFIIYFVFEGLIFNLFRV